MWEAEQVCVILINRDTVSGANCHESLEPIQAKAMHELRRILGHINTVGSGALIPVCDESHAEGILSGSQAGGTAMAFRSFADPWMLCQSVGSCSQ